MTHWSGCVAVPGILALMLGGQVFPYAAAPDGQLFRYKPHVQPLRYELSIDTKSQALALYVDGPKEERRDVMRVSQRVEPAGDGGLLDLVLTVEEINLRDQEPEARALALSPRGGSAYRRRDIIGNSAHRVMNLLGAVTKAGGIPHIGSTYFHPDSLAGPPLDIYPVMTMLHPQFPLDLLEEGDTWKVQDEIAIGSAEALPLRGIATLKHELTMTVRRDLEYELVGYARRGAYETAQIRFSGTFNMDGQMMTEGGGDYIEGSANSSGELYFARAEGLIVEAAIRSRINERKSQDGIVVHWFNGTTNIAMQAGQRTAEITWLTDQVVRFALADTPSR